MFNPAYIVSEEQIDHFVNTLSEVLYDANEQNVGREN